MKSRIGIIVLGAVALAASGCPDEATDPGAAQPEGAAEAENEDHAAEAEPVSMLELDEGPDEHILYLPNEIEWTEGPPSLEDEAQMAVLEGDPSEDGVFTMRLRLPDGFVINPHTHPNVERLTVMDGTFHLGHGEEVDEENADPLPPGSYTSMPPGMVHFAIAEGETIVQLKSVGPWDIDYVDPEDDPRDR